MPPARVAVIFHRLGPHHHARLKALGECCELCALEVSAHDDVYDWEPIRENDGFDRITLYHEQDARKAPARVVLRLVRETLDRIRPDAVVIPGWSDPWSLAACQWCYVNSMPSVLLSMSTECDRPRRGTVEWAKGRIVGLFDAAFVGGKLQREYLCRLGFPFDAIREGANVVDNRHFAVGAAAARPDSVRLRARLKLPDNYILAVSRFVPVKNLVRLVNAFAISRQRTSAEPGWALVILGDGELRRTIVRACEEVGLLVGRDVYLPGFKQYDELPTYYGLATGFVLPSISETWGLVVNEAMAAGLPVLVSDRCGCVADLVCPNENGWSFDPNDIESISNSLIRLQRSRGRLAEMGRRSTEIIANYAPSRFASGVMEAVTIAGNRTRRRPWTGRLFASLRQYC